MAEKPLHNFHFPTGLKWKTVHSRRRAPTPTPSPSPIPRSTRPEQVHAPLTENHTKNVVSVGTVDVEVVKKKTKKESKLNGVMTSGDKNEAVSKCKKPIIIKELVDADRREVEAVRMDENAERKNYGKQAENVTDFIGDEETVRSWNLRSRSNNGSKGSGSAEKGKAKLDVKGSGSGSGVGDVEKVKYTFPGGLTQTEIEEDFYAFGLKVPRRPKKRPKHVQNVLDRLFPGNNLTNISEERYHVSASSMKKQ